MKKPRRARGVNKTKRGADGEPAERAGNVSLEKKDVRTWLTPEAHAVLDAVADLNDKDIGEYASFLLERALMGEAHVAKVFAERVARWGKDRNLPEFPGAPQKAHPQRKS